MVGRWQILEDQNQMLRLLQWVWYFWVLALDFPSWILFVCTVLHLEHVRIYNPRTQSMGRFGMPSAGLEDVESTRFFYALFPLGNQQGGLHKEGFSKSGYWSWCIVSTQIVNVCSL